MIFLHIDPTNNQKHDTNNDKYNVYDEKYNKNKKLTDLLNEYIKDKSKKIFILFYMEGCGPCGLTRPEWKKIKNVMKKKDDSIVIVDIDHRLMGEIKGLKSEPSGFPTMRFITNSGKISEDYEDSDVKNKDRNINGFMEWINLKTGSKMNGGGKKKRRQKAGMMTTENKSEAFEDFIKNATMFKYFSKGSNGFTIIAKANPDYVSKYRYINTRLYNKPVGELLLKFTLLHDENIGQTKSLFYLPNSTNKINNKLSTSTIENFKEEINIQTDIFFKTMNYLQPICPPVAYASYEYNNYDKIRDLLEPLEERGDIDTHSIIMFVKSKFADPDVSRNLYGIGVIAMEFARGYDQLYNFYNKPLLPGYLSMGMYLLIRLAIETGYSHGDFHLANVLINPYSTDYFKGISGSPLLVDFGYSFKIPLGFMNKIKEHYRKQELTDILIILFHLGRSDGLSMYGLESFYGWATGTWNLKDNIPQVGFLPDENDALIDLFKRREMANHETVEYFDWLHSQDDEFPLLPLSNNVKNKLFEGLIGGRKTRKHKMSGHRRKRSFSRRHNFKK